MLNFFFYYRAYYSCDLCVYVMPAGFPPSNCCPSALQPMTQQELRQQLKNVEKAPRNRDMPLI